MRRSSLRCLALLATLPGAVAPAFCASLDASRSLEECVARLDAQADVGYERIAARCPDLTRKLEASGWSAWLPPDWKRAGNDLSAAGLKELQLLAVRELATRPATRAPRVERLASVLADLRDPDRHDTWHTQLAAWLREMRGAQQAPSPRSAWGQVMERVGLSQAFIDLLSSATLGVTVVLAALIVANELRVTGLLRMPSLRPAARPDEASGGPLRSGWHEIECAPLEERPRLLLTRIAAQLADARCFRAAHALTAGELIRVARLPEEDRSRLGEVARVAEHLRFSGCLLPPEHIAAAVERGHELLAHLDVVAAGARGPS
jgi:hypothetical protein